MPLRVNGYLTCSLFQICFMESRRNFWKIELHNASRVWQAQGGRRADQTVEKCKASTTRVYLERIFRKYFIDKTFSTLDFANKIENVTAWRHRAGTLWWGCSVPPGESHQTEICRKHSRSKPSSSKPNYNRSMAFVNLSIFHSSQNSRWPDVAEMSIISLMRVGRSASMR